MLIKMLQTKRGTEDGFSLQVFEEGKTYDVRDNMGARFNQSGYSAPVNYEPSNCESN